jgi:hypothetical protein
MIHLQEAWGAGCCTAAGAADSSELRIEWELACWSCTCLLYLCASPQGCHWGPVRAPFFPLGSGCWMSFLCVFLAKACPWFTCCQGEQVALEDKGSVNVVRSEAEKFERKPDWFRRVPLLHSVCFKVCNKPLFWQRCAGPKSGPNPTPISAPCSWCKE